ncbi:MAG: hypothetical protein ACYC7H_04690, partial [Chloroflexota bacterium]
HLGVLLAPEHLLVQALVPELADEVLGIAIRLVAVLPGPNGPFGGSISTNATVDLHYQLGMAVCVAA